MGKVMYMRKGEKLTKPSNFDPVLSNNTWDQIIEACRLNVVPDTWEVGDQKTMTINGTDYFIDIIGKSHDTYSDGSGTAPLTFQMHDCYNTSYTMNSSMTNNGGWTSCAMRTTHLPAILALMPSEVQDSIREINKTTSAGSKSTTINTTSDKLFLLSETEIFGVLKYSYSGEGLQYTYYKAGNSKVKSISGSTCRWWSRSPNVNNTSEFCYVETDGSASTASASAVAAQCGVAFAFCF
jgi:hypothetical protein